MLHDYMAMLQAQKDLGFLMNPGEGAISAVALYVPRGSAVPTHLFSGGVDGTLAVWSAGRSWDCLKVRCQDPCHVVLVSVMCMTEWAAYIHRGSCYDA